MPQTRTRRTWGTRFDPLPSSPPTSPLSRDSDDAVTVNAAQNSPNPSFPGKEDKMSHDASVFVGSLPSNVDQSELSRMLSEHLSGHTEVKSIKVVRDTKGGVCAFVQCEDSSSASRLIHNLQSGAPRFFLGRLLRYEPARAYRTLLISYRMPIQISSQATTKDASDVPNEGKVVQLELPFAMRLWRPKNAKYFSVVYNEEAYEHERQAVGNSASQGSISISSLYLDPVMFDEETMRQICALFGPIERFQAYTATEESSPASSADSEDLAGSNDTPFRGLPFPHNAPRSSSMSLGCWEIKWQHRDDCVTALMALRRVPHLTVTWAHQPTYSGYDHHGASPFQRASLPSPIFNDFRHTYFHHPHAHDTANVNLSVEPCLRPSQLSIGPSDITLTESTEGLLGDDADTMIFTASRDPRDLSRAHRDASAVGEVHDKSTEWEDADFPPLGEPRGHSAAGIRSQSELTTAGGLASGLEMAGTEGDEDVQELEMPSTPGLGRSPNTPKTPYSHMPDTPTSLAGDFQNLPLSSPVERSELSDANNAREFDPTTIFVGGLEANAWNQDRLEKYFSRFEGLEDVKFVRPLSGKAAFAFVKFNNTESPARAVSEEHNRVHDGREMRVQLREYNPSYRNAWKYGRGRGRYHHLNKSILGDPTDELMHAGKDQSKDNDRAVYLTEVVDGTHAPHNSTLNITDFISDGEPTRLPGRPLPAHNDIKQEESHHRLSPDPSSATGETSSHKGTFQDWDQVPVSATLTPPSSVFGSSASAAVTNNFSNAAYTMPSGGYYQPPTWVPQFAQPFQYPMPYGSSFQNYAPPPQSLHAGFSSPVGSDGSAQPGGAHTWPANSAFHNSYHPYTAYITRAPSVDHLTSPAQSSAPLMPTGFIHGQQGTLIPVYHPEALDKYMSSAPGASPSTTQPLAPAQGHGVSTWPQFYSYAQFGVPLHPHQTGHPQPQPQHQLGAYWGMAPNPSHHGYQGVYQLQPSSTAFPIPVSQTSPSAQGLHGGLSNGQAGRPNTPAPRRFNRREQQFANRNNYSRPNNNRQNKGNMSSHNYSDQASPSNPPNTSGNWAQWLGGN